MGAFQQVWGLTVFLEGRDGIVGGALHAPNSAAAVSNARAHAMTAHR